MAVALNADDFKHHSNPKGGRSGSFRSLKQTLEVSGLNYEVDERGMEWWQKLAAFEMPWKWCKAEQGTRKKILQNVDFTVRSGKMLAVLGSSGSGKTSLLDCIACQIHTGTIVGDIKINDKPRTVKLIKECSAYVRQNDRLLPHLTVRETLEFVAQLKLPKSWSKSEIDERVDSVIAELGLRHVSNSKVGGAEVRGISGGERRRVSIGIQLLLDPGILFLDEPTSGLDSFTAHHLVETLAKLAANGRIVMLTIHQPRSDIFELFDEIMLLSQGHVVYSGQADDMVEYFTRIGYPCPQFTNPCDFYVDLTTVDLKNDETESTTRERLDKLVELFKNQSHNAFQEDTRYERSFKNPVSESTYFGAVPDAADQSLVTNKVGQGKDNPAFEHDEPNSITIVPTSVNLDNVPRFKVNELDLGLERIGPFQQFGILFKRALTNNLEDYGFLGIQAIEAIFMSLMIGFVFFALTLDQISIRDRFGLLYIIGALYPYMVILDVIGQYHREKNIIYFEMLDGLYRTTPYFFSKILSEIPEHTVFIILYAVPVYFLTGLQRDASHFFENFAIVYATVYASRCLAMMAAALLPTYQISVLFAQSLFTIMLMSCGYIFNLDNIFIGVKWTSYISYLKWGNQGLCNTEFRGLNFTCDLPIKDSCIWTGEEALELYSLDGVDVWACAIAISIECLLFLFLFYIFVKFISQKPHEQ